MRSFRDLGKGRAAVLFIALFLLLPNASAHSDEKVTVIVTFSHQALSHAWEESENHGKADIERVVSSVLESLEREGIPMKVKDVLTSALHGAILEVDHRFVEGLKKSQLVDRVYEEEFMEVQLKSSISLIRADKLLPPAGNLTGEGVRVAIVDTGVDYRHPALGGSFGKKVVGGYDFVDGDTDPMDQDGHGTSLAGIVAAEGALRGVAPKAEILAYRVLGAGTTLRVSNVVRALDRAMKDGANVINLSLGSVGENEVLKKAIFNINKAGVLVVAAAGNFGPFKGSLSSPAEEPYVLAVGASMNNSTLSLASVLEVFPLGLNLESYPMNGTKASEGIATGELVYVEYARKQDVQNLDLKGRIALAERGGAPGELVYFSEKEANVASKGALALIVYNSQTGPFQGTLTGPGLPPQYRPPTYSPSIPVISMMREDALKLLKMMDEGKKLFAKLRVIVYPDMVPPYSSRGPNSPFILKPDLVAPGSFVNTTFAKGGYRVMSGTSFAAPHVAGAAALLLQRNPNLTPKAIISILQTTSLPLKDPMGRPISAFAQGSGRLDLLNAASSRVVVEPSSLVLHVAKEQASSRKVYFQLMGEEPVDVVVSPHWGNQGAVDLDVSPMHFRLSKEGKELFVTARFVNASLGTYEGRLYMKAGSSNITIPIAVQVNSLAIHPKLKDRNLELEVTQEGLLVAEARLTGPDGIVSVKTSEGGEFVFPMNQKGEYWLEVEARTMVGRRIGRTILEFIPKEGQVKEEPGGTPPQAQYNASSQGLNATSPAPPVSQAPRPSSPSKGLGSPSESELLSSELAIPGIVMLVSLSALAILLYYLRSKLMVRKRPYEKRRV